MWYTHYWSYLNASDYSDELVSVFNQAYQDFLRSWVTIHWEHINLFSVFMNREEDEETFYRHFHEHAWWPSWEPLLLLKNDSCFCKTTRKSYDVAVVLTFLLAGIVLNKSYSSDGKVIHKFDQLESYIQDELDEDYVYNIDELRNLFDIWLNKCITFSEEIQEVEDKRHVDRISDLPDYQIEYIAEQVKTWVSTIYLSNGQVVRISFE